MTTAQSPTTAAFDAAHPDVPAWFPRPGADAWRAGATAILKGRDPATLDTSLPGGVPCEAWFDARGEGPRRAVLGPTSSDRRQAGWDVRVRVDGPTLADARAQVVAAVHEGARSVWIVTDPRARGIDRDGAGVPLRRAADLASILTGLDLGALPVHLDAGDAAPAWRAAFRDLVVASGVPSDRTIGAVLVDPPADLARTSALRADVGAAYAAAGRVLADAVDTPWLHVLGCSGVPYADAGADGVQELACVLAAAAELLRRVPGVTPATLAARALVQVSAGTDVFAELARLRALRRAWAALMGAFGGEPGDAHVFVHAVSASSVLSARDPWVNTLRATSGGFSAALAGADAVTLRPWDEPLGVSDVGARRLATTAQVVLEQEAHLARVVDPGGGCDHLEALTERYARAAWDGLRAIEAEGGLVAALVSGWLDGWLATARGRRVAEVVERRRPVLGVSIHPNAAEVTPAREPWPMSAPAVEGALVAPAAGATCAPLVSYRDDLAWQAGEGVTR